MSRGKPSARAEINRAGKARYGDRAQQRITFDSKQKRSPISEALGRQVGRKINGEWGDRECPMFAGTSGTTVVGNPLSGPIGLPQANNPGASTGTGGSAVGVIMPGMYFPGAGSTNTAASLISPFGTFGSTGVGGVGTYALTFN